MNSYGLSLTVNFHIFDLNMNEWVPVKGRIEVMSSKLYKNKLVLKYVMYKSVEINSYGLLLYKLYVGQSSPNKGDSARFFLWKYGSR